jgi:endonuclease/exonuclease/phosphatase family metal-dependent hydrolase
MSGDAASIIGDILSSLPIHGVNDVLPKEWQDARELLFSLAIELVREEDDNDDGDIKLVSPTILKIDGYDDTNVKEDITFDVDRLLTIEDDHVAINLVGGHRIIIASTLLKVMTFNLGYNVQRNLVQGTEAPQVELCQQNDSDGWLIPGLLSSCTANALNFISDQNPDIVLLQEVDETKFDFFLQQLRDATAYNNRHYVFEQHKNVVIVYDARTLGYATVVKRTNYRNHRFRPILVLRFGDLIVVNVHAPHHIDIRRETERALRGTASGARRVILGGDFNDSGNRFKRIRLGQKKQLLLKRPLVVEPSCCTDSDFSYFGDYILDTRDPITYTTYQLEFASDHFPIVNTTIKF